ncbi:MAG: YceD family protein [Burkholderiaceae bacterium]|jgi:uncharacterized protein
MIIDVFEFSRRAEEASGVVAVRDLKRMEVVEQGDQLQWRLAGTTDERGRPFIDLEVAGPVHMVCQRCLQPVEIEVDVGARFLVARSDAEADAVPLDEDGYDVVVGTAAFDVTVLVEDEVILSLPLVPKHVVCPQPLGAPGGARTSESPFAVLDEMRKDRKP